MDHAAILTQELMGIAMEGGAELFGVADLGPAREFVEEQGGPFVASFPRAVSVAVRLSLAMVEQVTDRQSVPAIRTYRHYIYQVVNPSLDQISAAITRRLVRTGYRAYLVPASDTVDRERLQGVFSHKVAAHLAGLGHIGKSCLLVTEDYGAQVRLGTVLTDAPLKIGLPMDRLCGECNRCVEICPVHAYSGVEFRLEDPREMRFKADVCDRYMRHREKTTGARACGLCLTACDGRG